MVFGIFSEHSQVRKLLIEVEGLKKAGNIDKAIEVLEDGRNKYPKNVNLSLYLALEYGKRNDFDKGLLVCDSALKNIGNIGSIHFIIAELYFASNNYDAAIASLKIAISLDDKNAVSLLQLVYEKSGDQLSKRQILSKKSHSEVVKRVEELTLLGMDKENPPIPIDTIDILNDKIYDAICKCIVANRKFRVKVILPAHDLLDLPRFFDRNALSEIERKLKEIKPFIEGTYLLKT